MVNVRYFQPKGCHTRVPVRTAQPWNAPAAPSAARKNHQRRGFPDRSDRQAKCLFPRTGISHCLQAARREDGSGSHKNRSDCDDFALYCAVPRYVAKPPARWWRNRSVEGPAAYPCIRSDIRVASEAVSFLLLDNMKHKHVVICPGGMAVYVYAGFFNANPHILENVETLVGASAGAIYGLFPALGFSPSQTLEILLSINLKELLKPSAVSFVNKYGIYSNATIRKKLVEITKSDPVFDELDVNFIVACYCVNTQEMKYFSKDTTPQVKVIDAVMASAAVPFLVEPVMIDDMFYIDGGFCDVWPVDPVLNMNPDDVLRVYVKYEQSTSWIDTIPNISEYIKLIVKGCVKNRRSCHLPCKEIALQMCSEMAFDFAMEYDKVLQLVIRGQNATFFLS